VREPSFFTIKDTDWVRELTKVKTFLLAVAKTGYLADVQRFAEN
tara:strand:- start:126 stop:257 length:132 start_codon:yes stop_codon:yes gene_type:complete